MHQNAFFYGSKMYAGTRLGDKATWDIGFSFLLSFSNSYCDEEKTHSKCYCWHCSVPLWHHHLKELLAQSFPQWTMCIIARSAIYKKQRNENDQGGRRGITKTRHGQSELTWCTLTYLLTFQLRAVCHMKNIQNLQILQVRFHRLQFSLKRELKLNIQRPAQDIVRKSHQVQPSQLAQLLVRLADLVPLLLLRFVARLE